MRLGVFPKGQGPAPLFWRNETSGVLAKAVLVYLNWRTNEGPAPNAFEVEVLRAYFEQWINAPVWMGEEIEILRRSIKGIQSEIDLWRWVEDALKEGIDPL